MPVQYIGSLFSYIAKSHVRSLCLIVPQCLGPHQLAVIASGYLSLISYGHLQTTPSLYSQGIIQNPSPVTPKADIHNFLQTVVYMNISKEEKNILASLILYA